MKKTISVFMVIFLLLALAIPALAAEEHNVMLIQSGPSSGDKAAAEIGMVWLRVSDGKTRRYIAFDNSGAVFEEGTELRANMITKDSPYEYSLLCDKIDESILDSGKYGDVIAFFELSAGEGGTFGQNAAVYIQCSDIEKENTKVLEVSEGSDSWLSGNFARMKDPQNDSADFLRIDLNHSSTIAVFAGADTVASIFSPGSTLWMVAAFTELLIIAALLVLLFSKKKSETK